MAEKTKKPKKVYPNSAQCGERIRRLREEADLSQEELGRLSGYTEQHISSIELGHSNVPTETLCRIANALLVAPSQLYGNDVPGHARLMGWLAHERPEVIKMLKQMADRLETLSA